MRRRPRRPGPRPPAPAVAGHLLVMTVVAAVLGVVVAGLAIPFAGLAGIAARSTADTIDELPRELDLAALPQRTRILDRDGDLVATVFDQNRVNVRLDQVSRTMVEALLSIEDYRFYHHGALDVRGTLRAFLTNQASGSEQQGGSSITQQLVKLTLLEQADTPAERRAATVETYARKIRELRYAIALEQERSKDWILERYLNTAYFGDGAYGVQAAARHYFSTNASRLDLRQAALLAGLVQSPTAYDPTDAPARAEQRRDVVLARMAELGAVSQQRARKAQRSSLGLRLAPTPNGCTDSPAPFFCAYVLSRLARDPALGRTREERERLVRSGGLTIRTTLDLDHQAAADAAVAAHTDPTDRAIGALAIVEPGTGEVRALAQSRPMGADRRRGQTFLNHVVPAHLGGASGFQAGSTFKAFVLAAAVEQGVPLDRTYVTPNSLELDQSDYDNCPGATPFAGTFTVGNNAVPSEGRENLYSGTRRSINTFYLLLEQETGVCAPYELARRMGVRLTAPEGRGDALPERVPIFPLGVADVSPLEMAEAYATFAARGRHCASRPVTAIRGSDGTVLREYPERCQQVMEASTADAVNDVLRGVVEPGGFASDQGLDQAAAGKTGNNEGLSVWFVGYTPNLAAAAVIAGADEAGTPALLDGTVVGGVPVYGASGSAYAAPIWGDAMKAIDDALADLDFVYPSDVPGAGVEQPYSPPPPAASGGREPRRR